MRYQRCQKKVTRENLEKNYSFSKKTVAIFFMVRSKRFCAANFFFNASYFRGTSYFFDTRSCVSYFRGNTVYLFVKIFKPLVHFWDFAHFLIDFPTFSHNFQLKRVVVDTKTEERRPMVTERPTKNNGGNNNMTGQQQNGGKGWGKCKKTTKIPRKSFGKGLKRPKIAKFFGQWPNFWKRPKNQNQTKFSWKMCKNDNNLFVKKLEGKIEEKILLCSFLKKTYKFSVVFECGSSGTEETNSSWMNGKRIPNWGIYFYVIFCTGNKHTNLSIKINLNLIFAYSNCWFSLATNV